MFEAKNLTKKGSLNVFASMVDNGMRVIIELIITPLLVAGLGGYLYGLWRILWRMNGYLDAAGGRAAQALKLAVARDQTFSNYDEKRAYIGGSIAVWLLFLPLLMTFGGLLVWLVPVFLKIPEEYIWTAQLTVGLLALNVIILGLADIPRAVLQGENLGYKRLGLSAILILVGGGLIALAVHLHLGLIGMATATIVTTLLNALLFLRIVRKYVPWFGAAKPSYKIAYWFSGLSFWFVIWKFVSQLMLAGDVIILGVFDSVSLVAVYSLTKFVPETLIKLIGSIVFGVSPGLGGIIGSGDLEKVILVRNEIMSFTWLLLTVAGSGLLLLNASFIKLWVGEEFYAGLFPTFLIILMVAQISLIRNDGNIIDLTLNIKYKVLIGAISEVFALSLAALLVSRYNMGIVGVCVGSITGHFIISLVYPLKVGRFLGISFFSQIKSTLRPIFVSSLILMLTISIVNHRGSIVFENLNTWPDFVFGMIIMALIVFVLAFYGGLTKFQRKRLLKRLNGVIVK